jgi:hypothetical protein
LIISDNQCFHHVPTADNGGVDKNTKTANKNLAEGEQSEQIVTIGTGVVEELVRV